MTKKRSFLTVLFADISRSTQLFEVYGDVKAQHIVSKVLSVLSRAAEDLGGTVIKTIGDEVMCSFSQPESAFQAACMMQECLTQDQTIRDYAISIRVGFHCGDVIRDELNDVFGDAVNLASRMVDLAKAGEIITCRETVELLPVELRARTRRLSALKIKGKLEEIEVFDVLWQQDISDLTVSFPLAATFDERRKETTGPVLILQYGDVTLKADEGRPIILIGRGKGNDLIIAHPNEAGIYESMVSRNHASIEYRKGRFIVRDQSSNGIGIHPDRGEACFIHREEYPLQHEGKLILGGPLEGLGTATVLYRVEL
jgi:adenylate cyclase